MEILPAGMAAPMMLKRRPLASAAAGAGDAARSIHASPEIRSRPIRRRPIRRRRGRTDSGRLLHGTLYPGISRRRHGNRLRNQGLWRPATARYSRWIWCADRIAARVEYLENRFSTYRENSEISRFNAHPGQDWFSVSPAFLDVLRHGIAISELSGGAFDMTVSPLVELWGFGAGGHSGRVPPREAIDRLLPATGYTLLELRETPPAVRRTHPGVQLDFSAIAKGYAVDEIWRLLAEEGLSAYTVEIGGEVRTRGRRADGRDWSIGIVNPVGAGVAEATRLRDAAIATSGDYRNFFEYEGRRYSHTIDPRTGWPVSHDLTAVSVVNSTAATADALATALLVLGSAAGLELAEREGIAARLVLRTADGLKVVRTPAYEALP